MLGVGEEDDEVIATLEGSSTALLVYRPLSPSFLSRALSRYLNLELTCCTALRKISVDVVTFGQYMRPTKRHMKVTNYVLPSKFEEWKTIAEGMGFLYVASGPLVRSSFKANELLKSSLGARLLNNRVEKA